MTTLSRVLLRFRRLVVVALHLALIPAGYGLAFVLRFDGPLPAAYLDLFVATAPILIVLRMGSFALFRLFNGWWRHVGMWDLTALVKATTLSSAAFAVALLALGHFPGFPRSILILDWILALLLFGGLRFAVRWWRERGGGTSLQLGGRRTLIVGAGNGAAHLLRRLKQDPSSGIQPVGLVDDDPNKQSLQLHGVPVLGTTRDLEGLVERHAVQLLVLAIPAATREERRRLVERCSGLDVELKIVPDIQELIDGRAALTELRDVKPWELLGRAQVNLDLELVRRDLEDRVVLVTGGAGSIGSELARQVAAFRPRRLVLLEQAETPLYYIEHELRASYPELELVPVVGDVTDLARLERVYAKHRPEVVFHAAAYKHVPMMESNLTEAVRNNVLGTLNVAETAVRYGAEKFVLISTDKAVRPSSVMGATKRVAERIVLEKPDLVESRTDFRAVRFGNVLGSAGSVIPLFRRQIAAGGPVTVTHPEVTRYFMTIPEAVQLVLQAAALPEAAGHIAMLEMGRPVKILEMAENLVRLSGLEPYEEMPIVITGLRPGEKLHEELMSDVERTVPTEVDRIRLVRGQDRRAGASAVSNGVAHLVAALGARDADRVLLTVADLVPEAVQPLKNRYREASAREAVRPGWLGARPQELWEGELSLDSLEDPDLGPIRPFPSLDRPARTVGTPSGRPPLGDPPAGDPRRHVS